jgi:spermidine synthase
MTAMGVYGRPLRASAAASRPRVEVKFSRRGRALRIDGTFASWYEPGLPITGSVWDALGAPLLLLPPARRQRVLILGLGGGSVARLVRALAPRAKIVGVEMSGEVLRAARRHLDLDALGVEIVQGDARRYLARCRRSFDVVIEDIFLGQTRSLHKPDWLPVPGYEQAAQRLAPGGLLIANTIDETRDVARELRRLFPATLSLEVEDYENRVLVGGPSVLSARNLRGALARDPVLSPTAPRLKLRTLRRSR